MKKILITGLVAAHLAVSFWHGSIHTQLSINLSPAQNLFVVIVILLAPVVGAVLVWTRFVSAGVWIFLLSMLGALLFGLYHHYMLVSPDNINFLPKSSPEAGDHFKISAAVIALVELASALYGAFCLGARRAQSPASAK